MIWGAAPVAVRHRGDHRDRVRHFAASALPTTRLAIEAGLRGPRQPLAQCPLHAATTPRSRRSPRRSSIRPLESGAAGARRADRHRFRGEGLGDAAEDPGAARRRPISDVANTHRPADRGARRRRGGGQEPDLASSCPATAWSASSGALTGYHWGLPRKRAILGWESGRGWPGVACRRVAFARRHRRCAVAALALGP